MKDTRRRRHSSRVRTRSTRRLKLVMLAVGSVGLLIGVGFLITAKVRDLPRLQHWGAVYVCASAGMLAVRKAMMVASQGRSHRSERSGRSHRHGGVRSSPAPAPTAPEAGS